MPADRGIVHDLTSRRERPPGCDSGFTLLEVLLALAIVAGVILTVIASFNYHLSVVARDRDETAAVLLARAKLDDPDFRPKGGEKGTFAPERPEIKWAVDLEPTAYPGVKRMALVLTWDSERRRVLFIKYVAN